MQVVKPINFTDAQITSNSFTNAYANWSSATINYGDIGYLEVKPVIAGIDEWYDGDTQQKYRYNNVWFIKFVPQRPKNVDDIIIQ